MSTNKRNNNVRLGMSAILAFFMCMVIASWAATQYFASVANYQGSLGEEAFSFGHRKIYQPFSWWLWNLKWMNSTGRVGDYIFHTQLIVVAGAVISACIGFYLFYKRSLKSHLPDDLHGSARWANVRDIEKMKLISHAGPDGRQFKAQGPYIGAFDTSDGRKVLRYNEPAHLLCYAPSRSGKGVGPILTTLLSYPNSTFTNDIKGENFELSSGFRHTAGSLVIRFDPTALDQKSIDGSSRYNVASSWNVLEEIRQFSDYDEMDAQNIAAAIADPEGQGMDDHWVSTSFDLLTGVILHVLYYERDKSLAGVATYLADPSFTDPEQMYNRMLDAEHDPQGTMGWIDSSGNPTKTHPAVAREARSMLNKEEKERNSVLSTAKTKLTLYAEPIVARNTARSDFKVSDLMNHVKPVSLYMVVPPSDKDRLRPLIRLFITFTLRRLTKDMEFEDGASAKSYKHKLLGIVDELAALKKLDVLQDGLGYLAGYGITMYLFVQDTIQLKEAYGDNETITSGCQIRIAFAPNTLDTAESLSKMTGSQTRTRQNVSYSGSRFSATLGQMSVSEDLIERPLMTADEVMKLSREDALIFNAGHPPILAKKLYFFKMPEFASRAKLASPSRVAMSYRDDSKQLAGSWFMVSCLREEKSANTLNITVNCYKEFPAVRLVVKQEDLHTEQIREYDFELIDRAGQVVDRPLTVDDLTFYARPVGSPVDLDLREAFEVHFVVKDQTPYKNFSQKGFFRDIAVCERDIRRHVKDHYRKLGLEQSGSEIDVSIEKISHDERYSGTVVIENSEYIVLERSKDLVSIHRKAKLSRLPKVGDSATIAYNGKQGSVL